MSRRVRPFRAFLSYALLVGFGAGAGLPPAAHAQTSDPVVAAEAALAKGDAEQALEILKPVLKRDAKNARALLARSTANCQLGEVELCRKDLDQALKLDPRLRQGWLNRSAIAISEKRYDEALAALLEAEKLDPSADDNALNQGAVLLLQGKLEPASARFQGYLDANPRSADAFYLVATNFALAGYSALAVQHLSRAIELDERSRVRARTDGNFADMAMNRAFADLMVKDSFRIAPGSSTAERIYRSPYRGSSSLVLTAALNALQLSRIPMSAAAEVTDEWALLWADLRIKVARHGDTETALQLSAPPGAFTAPAWEERTRKLFEAVELELFKLEKSGASIR